MSEPEKRKTPTVDKWQIVENIAAAIERVRSVGQDVIVTQKAEFPTDVDGKNHREIDVAVRVLVAGRLLTIGVDVKDKSRAVDIETMQALIAKWSSIRGSVDRYAVASTSGFSSHAEDEARRHGVELIRFRGVQKRDIPVGAFKQHHKLVRVTFDPATIEVLAGRRQPLETEIFVLVRGARMPLGEFVAKHIPFVQPHLMLQIPNGGELVFRMQNKNGLALGIDFELSSGIVSNIEYVEFVFQVDVPKIRGEALEYEIQLGLPEIEKVVGVLYEDFETSELMQLTMVYWKLEDDTDADGMRTLADIEFDHAPANPKAVVLGKSAEFRR